MFKNPIVLFVIITLQFILVVGVIFYVVGIKKYGTPAEYKAKQEELKKAAEDSLKAFQGVETSVNIADSTLAGMAMEANIVTETDQKSIAIKNIESSIDSLNKLKNALDGREQSIVRKDEQVKASRALLQDEMAGKLALLYDNMKPQLAVPLFVNMSDTLAVKVLSRMQPRNASKLLGLLAEKDMNKATRLNEFLSMKGLAK
jgi:flagellar motility protein MotE (MotC chaperone)